MKLIGVDLAWGFKRPSALCVIRSTGGCFHYEATLYLVSLQDFASFFHREEGALHLAIDAPLTVKNEKGNRQAEREIALFLRKFRCGILPVNLTIVREKYPGLCAFFELLRDHGFRITPPFGNTFRRVAFEVFPPLTVLGLWGEKTLSVYRQEKRARQGFPTFIERLCDFDSSPFFPPVLNLREFFLALKGSLYGIDAVDAFLCAYTACFLYARGREGAYLFGNPQEGEVVMPLQEAQRVLVSLASSRA